LKRQTWLKDYQDNFGNRILPHRPKYANQPVFKGESAQFCGVWHKFSQLTHQYGAILSSGTMAPARQLFGGKLCFIGHQFHVRLTFVAKVTRLIRVIQQKITPVSHPNYTLVGA